MPVPVGYVIISITAGKGASHDQREHEMKLQFRVYKLNGTKCIRKFDSLGEAQSWVWVHEDLYRVDWVEPALVRNGHTVIPERNGSWNNRYVA